jgi:drug/metabolite transporter (DMT)-like permease
MEDHVARRRLQFGPGERWAWTSALAYGVVNVMLRAAAPHIDAWLGSLLRLLPVAALAWFMLARSGAHELRPRDPRYLGPRLIGGVLLGGAISYVIGNVFLFRALVDGGLAISVNASQAGSVWGGVLLGALLIRERPRREQIAGALIIAAGLSLIAVSQLSTPGHLWYEGLLLAIGAGVCYATANVFTRLVQRHRAALFAALACAAAGGLVPLLLVTVVRTIVDPAGLYTGLHVYDVAVVLAAGCVNVVALGGVTQAVRYVPVATANTIGSAQIVFSLLASIFLFGEAVPLLMLVGVLFVIGGILAAQSAKSAAPPGRATAT